MTSTPSLHILVVEDNDSLREATVAFLQNQGHQVAGVVCAVYGRVLHAPFIFDDHATIENNPSIVHLFPFVASGRAKAMDETDGFVKVLTDAATDRLLAVHILGPRASDLIAECVTVMEYHGSAEDIARCTHSHPTLSEAVGEAARAAWAGAGVNF